MQAVRQMKLGVYVINTARGELIDTKALMYGLRKGIIAGAALDVLEGEEALGEHRKKQQNMVGGRVPALLEELHQYNVVVTPHCAFDTREAIERILDTTVENINAFAKGTSQNVVS